MGLLNGIGYIGLKTKSVLSTYNYLSKSFGFQINKSLSQLNQIVLNSGNACFKVNHHDSCIDTVYDIGLRVENIQEILLRAKKLKVDVKIEKNVVQIKSIVGNVIHTLIEDNNKYKSSHLDYPAEYVQQFDHITYCVDKSMSDRVIEWYEQMFDMNRIPVNDDESLVDGFIIRHKNKGMILKAFDYWKCAKTGVQNHQSQGSNSCKFIIAEELNENVPNQIGTFLREHNGPGIQHIGLLVPDIVSATKHCSKHGAIFMTPPDRYYDKIQQNVDIAHMNLPIQDFAKYGILVDSELPNQSTNQHNSHNNQNQHTDSSCHKYLLQVFTRPIFDRDTFFLELIERHGARGFGAGNIKALWDAVDCDFIGRDKYRSVIGPSDS